MNTRTYLTTAKNTGMKFVSIAQYLLLVANLFQYLYSASKLLGLLNHQSLCVTYTPYPSRNPAGAVDPYATKAYSMFLKVPAHCAIQDILHLNNSQHIIFNNASSCLPEHIYQQNFYPCNFPDSALSGLSLQSYKGFGVISPFAQLAFMANCISLLPTFVASSKVKLSIKPFLQGQAEEVPTFRSTPMRFLSRQLVIFLLNKLMVTAYTHALMILSWSTIRNFEDEIEPTLYKLQPSCGDYIMCSIFSTILTYSSLIVSAPFMLILALISIYSLKQLIINSRWPQIWRYDDPTHADYHDILVSQSHPATGNIFLDHAVPRGPRLMLAQANSLIRYTITGNSEVRFHPSWEESSLSSTQSSGFNSFIYNTCRILFKIYIGGLIVNAAIGLLGYTSLYLITGAWNEFVQLKLSLFKEFISLQWSNRLLASTSSLSIYLSYCLILAANLLTDATRLIKDFEGDISAAIPST